MILNLHDRFTLLGILPEQGDFVTLKIIRKLREELSPNEEEIACAEIKNENGQIFWKTELDPMTDLKIGEKATDIIVNSLKKLDKEQKLTAHHLELCEIFLKD